ncbi:MAG: Txe/YoeB family addiction module toxin [Synergistaceae bacterium]|nr:Txe/YoeB family addiction module toxin [Synergistaceae bacterium]
MYRITYSRKALKDIPKLKSAGLDRKAKALIDVIRENPLQNPPSYEKLSGVLQNLYSRRINIQHRLVYEVIEDEKLIKILSIWSHYERI